ncbi:hypothetical protein EKO27_g6079 [Xylaria grammica]|uniref:Aminoglycoside phosphotransferase domain-containing protein n=1 Tax=Xylaria grammica TaxID=363999 RepID=A0A439D3Q0_9PEZI|nr:hypothetical protein EKO27_g6079 [Xylaria grammica]
MSSYTPITLPYFAPANVLPASLPTLEQALSITDYLTPPPNTFGYEGVNVVRVGEHFIAKYGKKVRSIEGENMLFVQQHTTIPVPQVYAIYQFGEGNTMIIMEFVKGATLQDHLGKVGLEGSNSIREKLRAQVNELRRIPAPNYYGALGRRPFWDVYRGREFGPFDSFDDCVLSNLDQVFGIRLAQQFIDIKKFFSASCVAISTALEHNYPVFTHGDLHECNIIVRSDGTPVIIDYEVSGFYPSFYEAIVAGILDSEFDFLDEKFEEERAIVGHCHEAWIDAEIEELESGDESDGDSDS